uniref:Uncharacterized protein n=1 Tax=Trichobilharzia regenti TaxID=157069 RepID=A0AA85IX04_TRIRE|nr:unnamed protein product [Trichobilharzia regenti]
MERLIDELASVVTHNMRLDDDFDCGPSDVSCDWTKREFVLVLDKMFLPEVDDGVDPIEAKKLWMKFGVTAAAHVYKSVGQCASQALRVWLTNAAVAVILHGLLGELTTSTEGDAGGNTASPEEATSEYISLPDDVCSNGREDGNWSYGCWTVENLASSSEMRDVVRGEMMNACISVMMAAVVNYFEERCYTPSGFRRDSYAWRILRSGVMEKYGLTDEGDKEKAMLITGRWVSKLVVFRMATEHRQLHHPIRSVKAIGYNNQSLKKLDVGKYFYQVPAGFTYTRIAYAIANRMVRSVCIPLFENLHELNDLRRLHRQIIDDPFHYHTDGEYLTGSPRTTTTDTANNLFGRLITYLRIFEPESELMLYPQLSVNGETREKHYFDYSERWENILRVIRDERYMPCEQCLRDVLKISCGIGDHFPPDEEMVKSCWEEYSVSDNIRQRILSCYSSPHEHSNEDSHQDPQKTPQTDEHQEPQEDPINDPQQDLNQDSHNHDKLDHHIQHHHHRNPFEEFCSNWNRFWDNLFHWRF